MATFTTAISSEGRVRSMRTFTEEEVEILLNSIVCEKPKTNADRIRSFSDEELAELITSGELCAICPVCQYYGTNDCYMENEGKHKNCDEGIMQWLQSEVEE